MNTPLLTDLYQLTMAAAYWKSGRAEQEAVFHLSFRRAPFGGSYAVAAGLAEAVDWIRDFQFRPADLEYLASLRARNGDPLLPPGFLEYLRDLHLTVDVDALPEGTLAFPHEPLVRVRGPQLQGQLLESALLCLINFQTLIATKAARICQAAQGDPVIEFGLRRAQGPDGAVSASRAAFIGGCSGTSNVRAGQKFGIPLRGTHAHSWVMSFDTEREAFQAYAEALPHNSVFLVDTYDTQQGVEEAIEAGRWLRAHGHELAGIRLDSGDLAELSRMARRRLDEAGFPNADIVASNDLDEHLIENLKHQGARISVWGVGTRLVTGGDQAALGGVYKLGALRRSDGTWDYKLKLSEQPAKISNPGVLQIRRYRDFRGFIGDLIFDEQTPFPTHARGVDLHDPTRLWTAPEGVHEDLLVPVIRAGRPVAASPELTEIQARARNQLNQLPAAMRRFLNPQPYFVGLVEPLHQTKLQLLTEARRQGRPA
ncbi:MAG: nicotinate phosphoribosyltransferase [Verrucomicrobia bacterium]|nr:nicotinate phosphoribosyltransferase [Verrucomicrobiota bacterium]